MEPTTDAAILRVLVLMAEADGNIASKELQRLQTICDEYFDGNGSVSWHNALSSVVDLRSAATSIPESKRPLTLKLAYTLISACGEEQGFPINPEELYAFNALLNHLELTEDQREQAVAAAKRDLRGEPDRWSMLRFQFTKLFGDGRSVSESTL